MNIPCPSCTTSLNLPEDVEGKLVRCPSCQQVFRANREVLGDAIQAGMPERTPTAVSPRPFAEEPPQPSRFGDYEEDEPDRFGEDRRALEEENAEAIAHAKRRGRLPAIAMIAAGIFVLANIIVNGVTSQLAQAELGGPMMQNDAAVRVGQVMGLMCLLFIFGPMILFIFTAARSMLRLGSRGLIITGVVMNFLLVLILGGGVAVNVVFWEEVANLPTLYVLPTVVMNSISCVLNLVGALLSILFLASGEISQAYLLQSRAQTPRRRY